jgi:hypothetical protein
MSSGVKVMFMGTGGGATVQAKNSSDKGQRVILTAESVVSMSNCRTVVTPAGPEVILIY